MNRYVSTFFPRKFPLIILSICLSIPLLACSGGLEKVKMEDQPLAHSLPINTQPRILAIGGSCSIGIKDDGTVWSWGHDFHGCLGRKIERYDQGYIPAQVQGIKDAVSVVAYDQVLVLKKDGTVWSWGENDYRELGYDTEKRYSDIPRQIPGLNDVIDISVSSGTSYVVKKDGTVWGFGNSWEGMFGIDSTSEKQPLTKIEGLENIVRISAGSGNVVALDSTGHIWTWGTLGTRLGRIVEVSEPRFPKPFPFPAAPLQIKNKVVEVVGGSSGGLALLENGYVMSWGKNRSGTLGRNLDQYAVSQTPEVIPNLSQVIKLAGNGSIATALTKTGDLVAWGQAVNSSEFASLVRHTANAPVLIKKGVASKLIVTGDQTMAYVDNSGQAWFWMYNRYGQFGNGKSKETPSQEEWVTPQKSLWTTR